MVARYYYAAEHHYGVEFCNDYMILFRFQTRLDREAFVESKNDKEVRGLGHYLTEKVTFEEARRHFPNAFRRVGYFHDYSDERDWLSAGDAFGEMIVDYWSETNIEWPIDFAYANE